MLLVGLKLRNDFTLIFLGAYDFLAILLLIFKRLVGFNDLLLCLLALILKGVYGSSVFIILHTLNDIVQLIECLDFFIKASFGILQFAFLLLDSLPQAEIIELSSAKVANILHLGLLWVFINFALKSMLFTVIVAVHVSTPSEPCDTFSELAMIG